MIRSLLTLVSLAFFAAPVFADGVTVPKPVDGKYTNSKYGFFIGHKFEIFTWQDGVQYMKGQLSYSDYYLTYELPIQYDSGNHFVARGKGTGNSCSFELKFDLYASSDKIYVASVVPTSVECGNTETQTDRYTEPFTLYVAPPTPTCVCKEVVTADSQVLCTLPQVSHAVSGNCTPDACNSLIKEAGGACVAPATH